MKKYGERKCFLFVPISIGILVAIFMLFGSWHWHVLTTVFVLIRAIHYAINYPVREALYVPTLKEIKFKSKSWIDSFGQKFAKGFGSSFNKLAETVFTRFGAEAFISLEGLFFGVIIGSWIMLAYFLGKRYSQVVRDNKIIGV